VFSFGGSKPLTAGNGGAVVTSDDWVASKLNQWLDRPSEAAPLSELQASVLLPQLDRLQPCNAIRSETTELLLEQVRWLGRACQTRRPAAGATLYKLAFPSPRREELLEGLLAKGLPVGAGYRSMHRRSRRRCDRLGTLERSRGLGVSVALLDQSALLAEGEAREQLVSRLAAMG
jgi:dTDP-4-amino-4,6-dideoxygalactose transaminase